MKAIRLILVSLFAISMLAACGQSKDSGASVRGYGSRGATATGGLSASGYQYQLTNVNGANTQSVLSFLSVAMDTSTIGTISSVQIAGHIGVSCNSPSQPLVVNGANGILIRVVDSYAQQGQYAPIDTFMPVTSGTVMNGQMNLIFQDSYGMVQIQGSYSSGNAAGTVNGTIYFQNSNGQSGTMGSFSLPMSYFLTCQ